MDWPPSLAGNKNWGIPTTFDQVIANDLFSTWKVPSLGSNPQPEGRIDAFHQPIYTQTLFWKGPNQPVKLYINPREVFDRMFGSGDAALTQEMGLPGGEGRRPVPHRCGSAGGDFGDLWLTIMQAFGMNKTRYGKGSRILDIRA